MNSVLVYDTWQKKREDWKEEKAGINSVNRLFQMKCYREQDVLIQPKSLIE